MLSFAGLGHGGTLLVCVGFSVMLLILLIAVCRVHAFVALTLSSVVMGLAGGMRPVDVARSFQEGVGLVLSSIAVVVGLGTILGKLLAESRGAETIAKSVETSARKTAKRTGRFSWSRCWLEFPRFRRRPGLAPADPVYDGPANRAAPARPRDPDAGRALGHARAGAASSRPNRRDG